MLDRYERIGAGEDNESKHNELTDYFKKEAIENFICIWEALELNREQLIKFEFENKHVKQVHNLLDLKPTHKQELRHA